MSEIGQLAPWKERRRREDFWEKRWTDCLMDGAGLVPMLLWTEWVSEGNIPFEFPSVAG